MLARRDSRKLPIGDPDVDWEETIYLNLIIHLFNYKVAVTSILSDLGFIFLCWCYIYSLDHPGDLHPNIPHGPAGAQEVHSRGQSSCFYTNRLECI